MPLKISSNINNHNRSKFIKLLLKLQILQIDVLDYHITYCDGKNIVPICNTHVTTERQIQDFPKRGGTVDCWCMDMF